MRKMGMTDLNAELALFDARPDVGFGVGQETGETSVVRPAISDLLARIERHSDELELRYRDKLTIEAALSRGLVSFQASKSRSVYRWYKFKEAFSADLVEFLLSRYRVTNGTLLDPFAGSGTALFASSHLGIAAEGIELLPIGQRIIETKQLIDSGLSANEIARLKTWANTFPWRNSRSIRKVPDLRITRGAYSKETLDSMEMYLSMIDTESPRLAAVLFFALLCVLEIVSFTRKDGQYLRWDYRAGRRQGKRKFDKGQIPSFDTAVSEKLNEIVHDLEVESAEFDLFPSGSKPAKISLSSGSCLEILPSLESSYFDSIVTSPPYCNRYDYTRTYALELALLGVDEANLVRLRQEMVSCTVENRKKDLVLMNPLWIEAIKAADHQIVLQTILSYLEEQRDNDLLNNDGIPRMVRGYFYEMACVIFECARVLKPGARLFMINDNVRYAGVSIPVDLILSDIAAGLNLEIEQILVLPTGKGNSSQQMGTHGRDCLRKCVYVWKKPGG